MMFFQKIRELCLPGEGRVGTAVVTVGTQLHTGVPHTPSSGGFRQSLRWASLKARNSLGYLGASLMVISL